MFNQVLLRDYLRTIRILPLPRQEPESVANEDLHVFYATGVLPNDATRL
jgi:hypothetical protein